jgi:hypothetical protein
MERPEVAGSGILAVMKWSEECNAWFLYNPEFLEPANKYSWIPGI